MLCLYKILSSLQSTSSSKLFSSCKVKHDSSAKTLILSHFFRALDAERWHTCIFKDIWFQSGEIRLREKHFPVVVSLSFLLQECECFKTNTYLGKRDSSNPPCFITRWNNFRSSKLQRPQGLTGTGVCRGVLISLALAVKFSCGFGPFGVSDSVSSAKQTSENPLWTPLEKTRDTHSNFLV